MLFLLEMQTFESLQVTRREESNECRDEPTLLVREDFAAVSDLDLDFLLYYHQMIHRMPTRASTMNSDYKMVAAAANTVPVIEKRRKV